MFAIIDLGISNITSVSNAFRKIGFEAETTNDKGVIEKADGLVLPGVGAFEEGITFLRGKGLSDVIRKQVLEKKVPILGICLGMQLLADVSAENGKHEGLGLLGGRVERLEPTNSSYRVPNIGWSPAQPKKVGALFDDLQSKESFYFVHSYYYQCNDLEDIAATIDYSDSSITVAVERENICGVQFHPEKSQDPGLNLLHRYINNLKNTHTVG